MDKVRRQDEEAAFAAAYDKAVEQINKNGVKYYSALIQKYMRLMNLLYVHYLISNIRRFGPPRKANLLMARNFLSSGKVSK